MVERLLNPDINWDRFTYNPDVLDELSNLALQIDNVDSKNYAYYMGTIAGCIREGYVMNAECNKLLAECLVKVLLYYCALWEVM